MRLGGGSTFRDRQDAGRQLAAALADRELVRPLVLALPRGGVPVAYEVAVGLDADLEVLVVRKIGAPFQPELGLGAIAEGGEPMLDERALASLRLDREDLQATIANEREELRRRIDRYRAGRPLPSLEGRDVVVVDDGLATGVTARAALRALRDGRPARLLLAVPVGAPASVAALATDADEVVCLHRPRAFSAVGQWYDDFEQTDDETVLRLLDLSRRRGGDG